MNRTKTLVCIVLLLIFSIFFYIFCVKFDEIVIIIGNIIDSFTDKEVLVPDYVVHNKIYKFDTVDQTEEFVPHNVNDIKEIYYTVLNNGWDSFTFYCPDDYKTCIDDVKEVANESNFISIINNYVTPYNSYKKYNTLIIGDDEVSLTIEKLYTSVEIATLKLMIEHLVGDLGIDRNNVTRNDLKKIHDFLINLVTYDEEYVEGDENTISNKANGALLNKIALCSGYTDTYALFMDELNIKNFKVSTENHVWNVVYFDNQWLHIDVTWDDDDKNNKANDYFFLVNTDELLKKDTTDHSFDQTLYLELNQYK